VRKKGAATIENTALYKTWSSERRRKEKKVMTSNTQVKIDFGIQYWEPLKGGEGRF